MEKIDRGFLIVAANTQDCDYIACARVLAKSLRFWNPETKICLLTDHEIEDTCFDIVKIFPHGDMAQGTGSKMINDWQVFDASPFHETLKIEADCVASGSIEHWWDMARHRDVLLSVGCLDHQGRESDCRSYRKVFDRNNLLDVYNAVTYWRYSRRAKEFFNTVRMFFQVWNDIKHTIPGAGQHDANTDLIYALAAKYLGESDFYIPGISYPKIVHMKPDILGIQTDDWTKELIWEVDAGLMRINGFAQSGIVHYHKKTFCKELEKSYDTGADPSTATA